jgi:hypothetical protein
MENPSTHIRNLLRLLDNEVKRLTLDFLVLKEKNENQTTIIEDWTRNISIYTFICRFIN